MSKIDLRLGDCLDVLKTLDDNSVDSIVTDPPYGLSFMGKAWDKSVPSVEVWQECLRVLKPGGHLLAFAGTRTQHRMAVAIEDAGFEIRDMIAWMYSTGFPKSHDVSKGIDKVMGAERKVVGTTKGSGMTKSNVTQGAQKRNVTEWNTYSSEPASPEAKQWEGWGSALKPSLETITLASKPLPSNVECDLIISNLIKLETQLWLLSRVNVVEKNSTLNLKDLDEAALDIAQWTVEEVINIRADLSEQMGMSQLESGINTSLNIVSLWRNILEEHLNDMSMSTTKTKSSMIIDWKTLKFSLSLITPNTIIKAVNQTNGFTANVLTAESHFNASLALLRNIQTLSVTEPVISKEVENYRGKDVSPNLDPCVMARKPFDTTIAKNVLQWGTGGINIDACRVPTDSSIDDPRLGGKGSWNTTGMAKNVYGDYAGSNVSSSPKGRFPANLIHDGSDEVVSLFPETGQSKATMRGEQHSGRHGGLADIGENLKEGTNTIRGFNDSGGSASRFFYCAKASKKDRNEGLESPNIHPTLKPSKLMRYLCRLVTPPNGTVLDPFMGSGSTGKGAVLEGFDFIGIELDEEYLTIAKSRIEYAMNNPEKSEDKSSKSKKKKKSPVPEDTLDEFL